MKKCKWCECGECTLSCEENKCNGTENEKRECAYCCDEVITIQISKINIKTETFCTPWDGKLYCVDICEDAEERSAWLYNSAYGVKSFMLGEDVKQQSRESFLDLVFSNLTDYIKDYAEKYED